MDYLPTLGEKWPHSRGNVGKYSLHGASGMKLQLCQGDTRFFKYIFSGDIFTKTADFWMGL